MDQDTASRFVSSLVHCIRAFCHGYVQFSSSIEIVGHIYLNVDKGSKFNYIVNEEVSKNLGNLTTVYHTNSYHSLPPAKQILLGMSSHHDLNINTVSGSSDKQNSVPPAGFTSTLPYIDRTISVAYPTNIIQNDRGWMDRIEVPSQNKSSQDSFNHKSPPALSSSKHNLKGKKHLMCPEDPSCVIKREPEVASSDSSFVVRNLSNGKELFIEEESLMADEQCSDEDNVKTSSEPYPVIIHTNLEGTCLEHLASNVANLPASNESVGSETASTHPTKSLSYQIRHQIVEYANIVGNRPAARHFGVHESSIRHWRKKFGIFLQDAGVKRGRRRKSNSLQDVISAVVETSSLKVEEVDQP